MSDPWMIGALLVVASAVLAWLHLFFWTRWLTVRAEYAEEVTIDTPDGSAFELRRIAATDTAELPPVLLVHGIAVNHRNVDSAPDLSLARHLHAAGRDVWLLTLRSGRVGRKRRERSVMRFEAMVHHDVPLAIAEILRRTRAASVDYVGFSMGGMLLYAGLGRTVPVEQVRRAVFIGSPGRIELPVRWVATLLRRMPSWMMPSLWLRVASRMTAFLIGALPMPLEWVVFNRANVSRGRVARALVNLIEDIPGPLSADMSGWALSDGEVRVGGERVLDGLADVVVPALFFAGARDRIAPPRCVRAAYDAWGGARADVVKRFALLGVEQGAAGDYGHGDLAIGEGLPDDVFEPTARFLGEG